ncbi:thiol-disulfide oxidoreductase ResA [Tenuibacillus multivorans]|uniref:Peroxiredoxin n=1 Tax=Tenuibacillus multivorans TaxID=237069 RepID=A0A1G9W962_9BACI|nr:thiol-disulfide oxidoreductase ResA [Tenuibacillus multivorans]GEL76361.1 hypothetical protein TMU01_05960 [Tenuibacillus multivorans]SDM81114.1 Peroxiredoxin [Tenuibacillus multivorans]
MTRFILFIVIAISTLSVAVLLSNTSHSSYTTSILDDQFKDDSEKIFGTINHYFEHGYELNEKDVQSFEEYILKYKSDEKTTKETNIYDLVVNIILDAKDSYEVNQREDAYALRDALEMYLTHRQELKGYISPDDSGLEMVADKSVKQDDNKGDSLKNSESDDDDGNTDSVVSANVAEDKEKEHTDSTNLGSAGDKAPDFQLKQINKNNELETIRLSDLEGKGVILNFWTSFCKPCEAEMSYMQKLYEEYQDKGIEIVGINLDASELVVHRFIDKHDLTFPTSHDKNSKVRDLYKIGPIPSTFFISPDGEIDEIVEGVLTLEKLEQHFKQIQPK